MASAIKTYLTGGSFDTYTPSGEHGYIQLGYSLSASRSEDSILVYATGSLETYRFTGTVDGPICIQLDLYDSNGNYINAVRGQLGSEGTSFTGNYYTFNTDYITVKTGLDSRASYDLGYTYRVYMWYGASIMQQASQLGYPTWTKSVTDAKYKTIQGYYTEITPSVINSITQIENTNDIKFSFSWGHDGNNNNITNKYLLVLFRESNDISDFDVELPADNVLGITINLNDYSNYFNKSNDIIITAKMVTVSELDGSYISDPVSITVRYYNTGVTIKVFNNETQTYTNGILWVNDNNVWKKAINIYIDGQKVNTI